MSKPLVGTACLADIAPSIGPGNAAPTKVRVRYAGAVMDNDVRARIGLIIPSSNVMTERQFRLYAPPDIQAHVQRMRLTGRHHVPALSALPSIVEAAQVLSDARCDAIVFHCTASSMEAGVEGDKRIVDAIAEATGGMATSTASAVRAALAALEVRRVVMVSPYAPQAHQHEVDYLAQAGIEVLGGQAMNFEPGVYASTSPSRWLEIVREHATPRAGAYFLSCTNIQSLEVIAQLEAELGKPVLASNQATLWYFLRLLGFTDTDPRLGRLFEVQSPASLARSVA